METFFIPTEADFRRWIKEAVKECLTEYLKSSSSTTEEKEKALLSRKEVAQMLDVSLVTLTDWMKRGLPFHKQRGRVYFTEGEVLDYIKNRGRPRY